MKLTTYMSAALACAAVGGALLASSSADCLTCHDGVIAKDVSLLDSHPVDVPYRGLPVRVPLENGLVTCKSCHAVDLTTLHWTATTLPMVRSELCLECHRK